MPLRGLATSCHQEIPKGARGGFYLQFALLVKVKDAFFKVVHLAEHQSFVKDGVIAPQQRHGLLLQHLFSLETSKHTHTHKKKAEM